jgi:hypothetical protein
LRLGLYSLLATVPGRAGRAAKRQWYMALALTRWALRVPKTPPQFGFSKVSSIERRGSAAVTEPAQ